VNEDRMRPGHWLGSVLCVCFSALRYWCGYLSGVRCKRFAYGPSSVLFIIINLHHLCDYGLCSVQLHCCTDGLVKLLM